MNTYLPPVPARLETIKESHVLEQVGEDPDPRLGPDRDRRDEDDQPHNRQPEEETQQPQAAHAQVPHALPELQRPQWEQHDGQQQQEHARRICLLLPLRALVEPRVVLPVLRVLLLLDAHRPDAALLH